MNERVAIVTGAGRGIGRAAAIELAKSGFQLALVSRTRAELETTATLCGEGAKSFICDVSDRHAVDKLLDEVLKTFGRVDALVHCAGLVFMRSIEALTPEEWRSMVDTNLSPIFFFCRRLWPVWRKLGGGVVVNVSSQAARDPFPGLGAYGAAKAGVNLIGLALSREGAEMGVRAHTVAPAATETAMLRSIISKEQVPTGKTLEAAEVARVIAQCVSGDLACTSGEVIYVHK
jgi:NAD(P)-dependent dehydrogenase (short-subunit alcohol dehydrogenase family)